MSTIPDPSSTQQQLLPLYAIKKKKQLRRGGAGRAAHRLRPPFPAIYGRRRSKP